MAIRPGARNSINDTPKTFGLSSPRAKEITVIVGYRYFLRVN